MKNLKRKFNILTVYELCKKLKVDIIKLRYCPAAQYATYFTPKALHDSMSIIVPEHYFLVIKEGKKIIYITIYLEGVNYESIQR